MKNPGVKGLNLAPHFLCFLFFFCLLNSVPSEVILKIRIFCVPLKKFYHFFCALKTRLMPAKSGTKPQETSSGFPSAI
jgi:hypothetical protein